MPEPSLSVVVPVLNEVPHVGRVLEQLQDQDPVPGGYEVLVVDGGSTDGTSEVVREMAARWPELKLLSNPKRRSGPARNIGAAGARGTYVLYLDGHCVVPRKDFLKRTVELFEATGADCLCRPQPLEEPEQGSWGYPISRARHTRFGHNPGSDIYSAEPGFTRPETAGAAYRLSMLKELGGYDERFDACEDVEFNHRVARAGYTSYKHPDLAVPYKPRDTLKGLFFQMMRYGRGRARLMARHPAMTPWLLVGLTTAAVLLLLALPIMGFTSWIQVTGVLTAAYTAACLAFALPGASSIVVRLQTAAVFPFIHGGLLAGFLRGLPESVYYQRPPSSSDLLPKMDHNATASS